MLTGINKVACSDPYIDLESKDAADVGNKLRAVRLRSSQGHALGTM